MPTLNAATLFAAWERGLAQSPVERALTLLSAAWPERSAEHWANVIIGERDEYLLRLRDEIFGPQVEATTVCAVCGERLMLAFTTQSVRKQPPASLRKDGRFRVRANGYEVKYRVPTSADLIDVAESGNSVGREILLRRCLEVSRSNERIDPSELPDQLVQKVIEGMARADPRAEIQIELACPACQNRRSIVFDVLSYLWSEIDEWARRLVMEVHTLASAYGWSESDIMAMSARRRHLYLQVLSG